MESSINEKWKDIRGYEGLYQVSNLGRVKALDRVIKTSVGLRKYKEQLLSLQNNNEGYKFVILQNAGKRMTKYVQVLVAEAFIPNPDNLPYVNHKDENKSNNTVSNLEWCTAQYNNCYGSRLDRISAKYGRSIIQYDLEGNFIKEWDSTRLAALSMKCDKKNINCCLTGKTKTACGFKWKYKDEQS